MIDALYLADSEATAWAEWYRYLAESGIPPQQMLPTYLWTWQVDVEVANLQSLARLKRVGLPRPRPDHAGWARFQSVGEAIFINELERLWLVRLALQVLDGKLTSLHWAARCARRRVRRAGEHGSW